METTQPATLLNVNVQLATSPEIQFVKENGLGQNVPFEKNGFSLNLEATLPYKELTAVLQTYLQGKRFTLSEGLFAQHVVVETCRLYGVEDNLVIEALFSGSFRGTIHFKGKPVYNNEAQRIELAGFGYDLETKNLLLKGARWLFDKIIVAEIQKHTAIDLKPVYKTISLKITEALNQAWTTGVKGRGTVTNLAVTHVEAQSEQLLLKCHCFGKLQLVITALNF